MTVVRLDELSESLYPLGQAPKPPDGLVHGVVRAVDRLHGRDVNRNVQGLELLIEGPPVGEDHAGREGAPVQVLDEQIEAGLGAVERRAGV